MGHNCLNPATSPGFFLPRSWRAGTIGVFFVLGHGCNPRQIAPCSDCGLSRDNEGSDLSTIAFSQTGQTPTAKARAEILNARSLADKIFSSLDEAKSEDIVSIDLSGKTALADAMIVATGRSTVHVGAIADRVIKACKAAGVSPLRVEGLPQCDWVLVDAGDLIVHIFRPEVRQFYNLEKMWGGDRPREMRLA